MASTSDSEEIFGKLELGKGSKKTLDLWLPPLFWDPSLCKINMLLNRYEGVEWRTRWHTCVWLGRSKGLIKLWSIFTTLCSYCGGAKGLRNIVKRTTEPRVQCFYLCQFLEWWQVVKSKPSVHCFQAVARPFSNSCTHIAQVQFHVKLSPSSLKAVIELLSNCPQIVINLTRNCCQVRYKSTSSDIDNSESSSSSARVTSIKSQQ